MNPIVKDILDDLYKLEPNLKMDENNIVKIIEKMIEAKPDTNFDEKFKEQLRNMIVDKIMFSKKASSLPQKNFLHNFYYFLGWVSLAWVCAFAWFYYYQGFIQLKTNSNLENVITYSSWTQQDVIEKTITRDQIIENSSEVVENSNTWTNDIAIVTSWISEKQISKVDPKVVKQLVVVNQPQKLNSNDVPKLAFGINIQRSRDIAFGKLDIPAWWAGKWWWWDVWVMWGNMTTESLNLKTTDMWITSDSVSSSIEAPSSEKMLSQPSILPYENIIYKYVYTWEQIDLSTINMDVLKKVKGTYWTDQFVSILQNFKFDTLNLNTFSNLNIESLNFSEDKEYGYTVNINFLDWTLWIWRNYAKWPQIWYDKPEDYEANRIKIEQIPSDEKALELASFFINKYWIDVSSYSKPYVEKNWLKYYNLASDRSQYSVPEIVTVFYPLKIEWKSIVEEYWNDVWLRVSIDVRTMKVTDVWWVESKNFIASKYDTIKDFSKVLDIASKWWRAMYESDYVDPNAKIKEISLGHPNVEYVQVYYYTWNSYDRYLVPWLVFPILWTWVDLYQEKIVVPLVKDFYNK